MRSQIAKAILQIGLPGIAKATAPVLKGVGDVAVAIGKAQAGALKNLPASGVIRIEWDRQGRASTTIRTKSVGGKVTVKRR